MRAGNPGRSPERAAAAAAAVYSRRIAPVGRRGFPAGDVVCTTALAPHLADRLSTPVGRHVVAAALGDAGKSLAPLGDRPVGQLPVHPTVGEPAARSVGGLLRGIA